MKKILFFYSLTMMLFVAVPTLLQAQTASGDYTNGVTCGVCPSVNVPGPGTCGTTLEGNMKVIIMPNDSNGKPLPTVNTGQTIPMICGDTAATVAKKNVDSICTTAIAAG